MFLNKLKNQQGFTIVELIVVIAITGIIITAAYTFLMTNQSTYFAIMAKADAQNQARNAMDNVMTNIRRAKQLELSKIQSGNELTLLIPDQNGEDKEFKYTVEKNDVTDLYELILEIDNVKYVVATDINGEQGFSIENQNKKTIKVKILTEAKKYNRMTSFQLENYHTIEIDSE